MKRGRKPIRKIVRQPALPLEPTPPPPPEPPMPAFWQGRVMLGKYKFPNFIQTCGAAPYSTDILQWLITHDAQVTEENFAVIGKQIKNYYSQPPSRPGRTRCQHQMSLIPHAI